MSIAVSAKKINVQYNDFHVLNDISFDIEKGSITAIIGPNGSGKTTLIKALLGLITYQGQVKIFNRSVQSQLSKISYVPQKFDFDRNLPITVREFLDFLENTNRHKIKRTDICHEVQVHKIQDKLIGQLSGGQLQRVLFAGALLNKPQILFLDEAAAGVDIEGLGTFYELIQHVNHKHNITVVMISHEINMVYKYANQILCLNHDLICNTDPEHALTKKVIQKLYGRHTQFNPHLHL